MFKILSVTDVLLALGLLRKGVVDSNNLFYKKFVTEFTEKNWRKIQLEFSPNGAEIRWIQRNQGIW